MQKLLGFIIALAIMPLVCCGSLMGPASAQTPNSASDPQPQDENGNPRIPIKVLQTSRTNTVLQWGHDTRYGLEVVDNQNPQGLYGLGRPQEAFSNIKQGTNPPGWTHNPGSPSLWDPGATFTDQNKSVDGVNPADYGETLDTIWYSFDQTWHDVQTPTGDYTLNVHHITHHWGYATRTY